MFTSLSSLFTRLDSLIRYFCLREESHRGVPESSGGTESKLLLLLLKLLIIIRNSLTIMVITSLKSVYDHYYFGWIIDSGANQHLTGSTYGMINVVDISDLKINVGHPNRLEKEKILGTGSESGGIYLFDANKSNYIVLSVFKRDLTISNNTFVPILKPQSSNDDGRDSSNEEGSLPHSDLHVSTQGRNQSDWLTATQIGDQNWSEGNIQSVSESSPTQNMDDVQTPVLRRLSSVNMCIATSLNKSIKPTCLAEALSDPNWVKAMNNEIEALNRNNTWIVYDLPIDVNNVFFYSDLVEDVYMTLPDGYNNVDKSKSKFDYSLYTKHTSGMFIALLVYVDDIVITGSDIDEINEFKLFLSTKFLIKDLGSLKYFLGIEVIDNDLGLCMTQRKYCMELLHKYGLLAARPVDIPLPENTILSCDETENDKYLSNFTTYQKLVRKLIYLTNTRPDISYVVHCLSQHMHSSLQSHFKVAENVLAGVIKTVKVSSNLQTADVFTKCLGRKAQAPKKKVRKDSSSSGWGRMLNDA
nr:ribonuclease H-like domain-containing protein [Tanacetum cinerariifolium]